MITTPEWEKVLEMFRGYGEDYVSFSIVDMGRLDDYVGVNFPDFTQAMANANMPPFAPLDDLRRDRWDAVLELPEVGEREAVLYDVALGAAWDALVSALARECWER